MALKSDRVGELLGKVQYKNFQLVSPEGVPLDIQIALMGERISAFFIDITIMIAAIILLSLFFFIFLLQSSDSNVGGTLLAFLAFLIRNLYFLHFELAWQGRTPGKKICKIRVINRSGGELTPGAIIARNLTREIEFFAPISVLLYLTAGLGGLAILATFGWLLVIVLLPFFNKGRLRAGDLIAGTQVIRMPKRVLLEDLSALDGVSTGAMFTFTHEQLSVYGAFELQVLEECLRQAPTSHVESNLVDICHKICNKISWEQTVPPHLTRRFLTDFYTAERANLEREQLFGRSRADKYEARKARNNQVRKQ